MTTLIEKLDQAFYPGFARNWDDQLFRIRGWAEADTFPTRYRANTATDVQRLAAASGLTVERLNRIEGRPEYLRLTWPTYLIGAAYERLINSWEGFALFRVLLIGELGKGIR